MFNNVLVRVAFHCSWFLLMLGGIALLEKGYWAVAGAIFLIFGGLILLYSFMAIYLNRQLFKNPRKMLLMALVAILAMVAIELILGKVEVAIIISIIALPVPIGMVLIKTNSKNNKK